MRFREWDELPEFMKVLEVKPYYDTLRNHKTELILKRFFDVIVASGLFVIFAIPMCILAIVIKIDSPGPVFYRQERVTAYGRIFRIHKFRTMVQIGRAHV